MRAVGYESCSCTKCTCQWFKEVESNTEGSTMQEGRHRGSSLNAAHPLPLRGVQEGLTPHLGRKT